MQQTTAMLYINDNRYKICLKNCASRHYITAYIYTCIYICILRIWLKSVLYDIYSSDVMAHSESAGQLQCIVTVLMIFFM